MIGAFPLRKQSPFAYPGTAPAVDPTHPASRKFLRFSGVAQGADFVRIDKILKGTITATITGGIDAGIGPYIRNAGTVGKASFAGNSTVAPTSCTIAAIFSFTTTGSVRIIFDMTGAGGATVPMFWVSNSDNNLHLGSNGGTKEFSSGLGLVANTPYFGVASYPINGSGNINFAVTNLQTGQVRTASVAHTFAATAGNGTYCVGGDGAGDTNEIAVAAAMYSTAGLSPGEVRAWAADPWSFWYPRKPDLGTMLRAPAGGSAFTLAGAEGAFVISGQAGALNKALKVAGAEGAFIISGQAVSLSHGSKIAGATGAFTISGQASAELRGIKLAGAAGAFAISGQSATLTLTTSGHFTLAGAEGAFTISGQAATLAAARKMAGAAGAFAISGQAATMQRGIKMPSVTGAFVINGQPAAELRGIKMAGATAAFAINGGAAVLSHRLNIAGATGLFTISGQAAARLVSLSLPGAQGGFVISGQGAVLTYTPISGGAQGTHWRPLLITPGSLTSN